MSGSDWTRSEVELIVDDYLSMLASELAGASYNKTAHRRALKSHLADRSDQSIEFKHSNISAALLDSGFPYNLVIEFKQTAPKTLVLGRPTMRFVQDLHWLKDTLATNRKQILSMPSKLLASPVHGNAARTDLLEGFDMLPTWMQSLARELPGRDPETASAAVLKRPQPSGGPKWSRSKKAIGEVA